MLATPFRSAKELAADIRKKKIGCLELLNLYLTRVEKHNPAPTARASGWRGSSSVSTRASSRHRTTYE